MVARKRKQPKPDPFKAMKLARPMRAHRNVQKMLDRGLVMLDQVEWAKACLAETKDAVNGGKSFRASFDAEWRDPGSTGAFSIKGAN